MAIQFTPLKFQIPLAAGGVALMAFNYLQFAVPHGKGLIKLSDIPWESLTTLQTSVFYILILIMLIFSMANLCYTLLFIKELTQWIADKPVYNDFINSPPTKSIGVFVPIASLSMTANVVLAPLAFFLPQLSSNLQSLMFPGLIFFGILWIAIFSLEFRALKTWLEHPVEVTKLNFIWLLDVFAFGLVSLTGTGLAVLSTNENIASVAAFASIFTLIFGSFLLFTKLAYLIYLQIKAERLPETNVLPAYFIVIPITCLFGYSFSRVALYMQTQFGYDMRMLSFFFITFSYVITLSWGLFCLYMLSGYFKADFLRSKFAPTQWGLVWALVGSQVLGVNVYGSYYPNQMLAIVNYVSVLLAAALYTLVLVKFYRAARG